MLENYNAEQVAEEIIAKAFAQSATTEDEIREFLVFYFGSHWRNCELRANTLQHGRVVYTAMLVERFYERFYNNEMMCFVIDRDEQGRLYVAPPSPVEE